MIAIYISGSSNTMITSIQCTVVFVECCYKYLFALLELFTVNDKNLPLIELITVNNNSLPLMKTFSVNKIVYR